MTWKLLIRRSGPEWLEAEESFPLLEGEAEIFGRTAELPGESPEKTKTMDTVQYCTP
jgi:hypothetical protein